MELLPTNAECQAWDTERINPIQAIEDHTTFESLVSRGTVLAILWSLGDHACHEFLYAVERLVSDRSGTLRALAVETEQVPSLAERFHIQVLPSLLLFRDGALVAAQDGVLAASAVEEWYERSMAGQKSLSPIM